MENIDISLDEIQVDNVDSVLTGPPGPPGFSPVATVSKTGNVTTITITDEEGTTSSQVTDGTDGADGEPNTLTIGTVTSGVSPSATITGDSPNQVLNLVLPKGDNGSAGADGTTPTITIGNVTTVSPSSPATVTNSGTSTNVILNFEIPQGVQGDTTGCLSKPTIVSELPAVGSVTTLYFVPKEYTNTTVTGDSLTLTITENSGRIDEVEILGYIEQDTPPANPIALTGSITITLGSTPITVDIGNTYLAKVNSVRDRIYYSDNKWYLEQNIGYIASYDGESIDTDYISTSGSLTVGDEVYYVLDDPVTTEIASTAITDPLNLIRTTILEQGTVTVTTSANVTCDLSLGYYSFDIHNQYDKYVYLIETSNYERI